MNKKNNAVILIVIFVLQLLVPTGMVAYTSYIEWGLENRAAVYKFELNAVEWMHPSNVYLMYDFSTDGIYEGTYCAVKTGADGFADIKITDKRPKGNYIRSQTGRWYNLPSQMRGYEPQTQFSEEDYRWLYFVPEQKMNEWGWRHTENYFKEAYAEVHIFKGHAVTKAVYIDGRTIEEHIAECVRLGIVNE